MKFGVLLALIFFGQSLWAQTALEVFEEKIHPTLLNRCSTCHGLLQTPLHSVADPGEAYKEARKLINLAIPERSALWKRSFNLHCDDSALCNEKDLTLLEGIKEWVEQEKKEHLDSYSFVAEAKVEIPANELERSSTTTTFFLSDGMQLEISATRLSENFVYFSSPLLKTGNHYTSLDGFQIRSDEVETKAQNFSNKKVIIKPTSKRLPITEENQGYILIELFDAEIKSFNAKLFIKDLRIDLSRTEAKQYWQKGYFLPREQTIIRPHINKVMTGYRHTCAVDEENRVKCWGDSSYGQTGSGKSSIIGGRPQSMGNNLAFIDFGDKKIKDFQLASFHNCALFEDDTLSCFGWGGGGSLGRGDRIDIGAGANHMGDNLFAVDLGDFKIKQLFSGGYINCALSTMGKLKCWGYNDSGQLGLNKRGNVGDNPNQMGDNLPTVYTGPDPVQSVASATYHTCAVFENGQAKCWGRNSSGELGLGNRNQMGVAAGQMESLNYIDLGPKKVMSMATGDNHTCALFDNKKIKCWGRNTSGQLGLGDTNNRGDSADEMGENLPYVNIKEPIKKVVAGGFHTCVLLESGKIKCWGEGRLGQLGYENSNSIGRFPDEIENLKPVNHGKGKVLDITAGYRSTCIVDDTRRIKCWGENNYGHLGLEHRVSTGLRPGDMGDALPYVDFAQILSFD